jgi:hypothetical protein
VTQGIDLLYWIIVQLQETFPGRTRRRSGVESRSKGKRPSNRLFQVRLTQLRRLRLRCAAALGAPPETPGIRRTIRVSRYPKAFGLAALVALVFVSTGLQAQLVNPSPPRLSETRPTQPIITCTVGRAGFIGYAGRQTATAEMVTARGLAYVAFGGAIFALVASYRLLNDDVGSFFAPFIPKATAGRVLRTIPPPDEDFRPLTIDPRSEPCAKQEDSRFAPGNPPPTSTLSEVPMQAAFEVPRLRPFSAKHADGSTPTSSIELSVNQPRAQGFVPTTIRSSEAAPFLRLPLKTCEKLRKRRTRARKAVWQGAREGASPQRAVTERATRPDGLSCSRP